MIDVMCPKSNPWIHCLMIGHCPKATKQGQRASSPKDRSCVGWVAYEISPDLGRNISNLELYMRNIMGRYELCTCKLGNWAATMIGNHGFSKADERVRNARRWKLCTSLYIFLGGPAKCIHLVTVSKMGLMIWWYIIPLKPTFQLVEVAGEVWMEKRFFLVKEWIASQNGFP